MIYMDKYYLPYMVSLELMDRTWVHGNNSTCGSIHKGTYTSCPPQLRHTSKRFIRDVAVITSHDEVEHISLDPARLFRHRSVSRGSSSSS